MSFGEFAGPTGRANPTATLTAFDARRHAVGRIGLPAVREHRLKRLTQEHEARMAALDQGEAATPDIHAVLMVRVDSGAVRAGVAS